MSAALQTAVRQSTALPPPPLPAPSNRQYTSPHTSPNREAYHANQTATASPSSRRPSRKTSGNGASQSLDLNSARAPRNGPPSSSQASERRPSTSDRLSSMPPVAPPRTSSSGQQGGSSRRSHQPHDAMASSQRYVQVDGSRSGSRGETNGQADNHRSKRAAASHLAQDAGARPSSSRDPRAPDVSMPIHTHQISTSKPPRDASENLNRAISNAEEPNGRDTRATYHSAASQDDDDAVPPPVVGMTGAPEERRGGRSRHDHSRGHKGTSKFGDFILGNTIGEGEFGKVKLGWKQDSSVQVQLPSLVAIKLIKRDSVGSNPSRLGKIRREVTILRGVQHPNIVRLIDMIETDRYIGIILEYASGGELFDYILNHRYLKDHSARRLFSQLVSGVGYLHKKGIVHRDLKLENLLLDRNRNIIITDFGFANTFDPHEELSDEEELNLTDRDIVRRLGLDKVKSNGMRKGDLMQTSCGSPCYAAPELVVSDSLYTGRKVDVWSCGVILYAMVAGYLPFDDDPANPEGDNINLLYKYIVSTPLTFPEYVTPHARDLLRRILVPNPRKRADLFEVARHSWLSEYAHVVEFITSSTTSPSEVQNSSSPPQEFVEQPSVARSASVRETPKQKVPTPTSVGGLAKAHAKLEQEAEQAYRTPKDAKRRTVQVEYVAPTTQTQRGEDPGASRAQTSRDYEDTQKRTSPKDKPLSQDPSISADASRSGQSKRPPSSHNAGPTRPARDTRAIPDNAYMATSSGARPQTGGSMQSAASMGLQSRGNYGQPVPPTIADTNVQGRIQQPTNADDDEAAMGRPSVSVPPKFARMTGFHEGRGNEMRGHKRSSTIGDIGSRLLGRSGSVFGGRNKKRPEQQVDRAKRYPPVSMSNTMPQGEEPAPRPSVDSRASRRSFSLGLGKKRSGSMTGSQGSTEKKERRRFSLLPVSFSLKSIGLGKDYADTPPSEMGSQHNLPIQAPRLDPPRSVTAPEDARGSSPFFDNVYDNNSHPQEGARSSPSHHQRYRSAQLEGRRPNAVPPYMQTSSHFNSASESSVEMRRPPTEPQLGSYRHGFAESEGDDGRRVGTSRGNRGVLQKNHKRFTDAYEPGNYQGHEGSSGAAKRVMDFFRRRGKARGGDDR
ncbi:Serine/threonine-protein kinase KIN4 [Tolypocladium ophioglossoides CBS 100239]|uniref:non-specific serine/threonine protein kinase n=1 Tax=Tolypocladium ophioglossoides (strain CBS 100239) TaxID=1163406 RepID=A0A0L0NBS2_TOLOC|nr:Serine/threonine-protein kinase KIN4 [Tolypocladium ophioglossoides CBS 100239]